MWNVTSEVLVLYMFYLTLLCAQNFIELVRSDVHRVRLHAHDFSLVIDKIPSIPSDLQTPEYNLDIELQSLYWTWANQILAKEDPMKNEGPGSSEILNVFILNEDKNKSFQTLRSIADL